MAKQCAVCQKGSLLFGKYNKLRGKYNPVQIKIRKYPNLQWVKVPAEPGNKKFQPFAGKRISACAKCIKSLGKNK